IGSLLLRGFFTRHAQPVVVCLGNREISSAECPALQRTEGRIPAGCEQVRRKSRPIPGTIYRGEPAYSIELLRKQDVLLREAGRIKAVAVGQHVACEIVAVGQSRSAGECRAVGGRRTRWRIARAESQHALLLARNSAHSVVCANYAERLI